MSKAEKEFAKIVSLALKKYYEHALLENIKRSLRARKLPTLARCVVNNSKV